MNFRIVNSNLNKACLIHDNDHTTGLPTVLDESQPYETALSKLPKAKDVSSLDSIAFFLNKCTFVKALKSLKDNNTHRDGGDKANLKEDIDEIERKIAVITTWSESVPDKMQGKLLQTVLAEFNKEVSDPPPMSSLQPPQADESDMLVDSLPNVPRLPLHPKPSAKLLESAARLTQITVILLRENHAKVKLYLPWVKAMPMPKHSASVEIGASRAVAAIDPARLVIELSQVLLPPLKYVLMAKFMKYSFGRFIFDSAVLLSHIAIYAPANGLTCIPLLETAMNLLSNAYHVRGFSGNVEQGKDSVRILSELHKKARAASEEHQNRFTVGNKRKRDDEGSSTEAFMGTFHVPFIGAGVKCYGIRRVAGEIAEQEAHGVTHPRVLPEEIQPPVAPSNRAQSPEKAMNSREKSTSLVESNSSSSSSTTKRRKTEGVTIRSRVMDKSKRGDGEHRRSSTTSRRQSAAPLTTRPRADSSLSSPVTSAPQSVVSEPLPQPTFSLRDTLHSAPRVPAPIQTNVRPTATSDIQPLTSPSHYMRPPSSLGPSRSTEFSHPSFDARHAVPSQQPPHPQRPTFGGAQFQQPFAPQSLANSPLSQYNSPQYQPPPLSQAEQYPESSMGMHPQGVEGPSYHIPSPVHVSANSSYAHQNQMLGVHSEQPMQGSSQQQQYYHPSMPPAHPPMLYDQSVHSQNHGEQQQQQQWMNNVNAPPPPGEWPGHSHQ
ncbi:hypothetical protein SCHPADRAFT_402025 [Schizopora paradoxa]|uniref:Uncharacterized protein n=1 Tax=Schizopora paradoxa TaxID=27342 RepID=A0A0H2RLF3_9AGAM|nr:hypothetical protein SCHPADRAFT_402025 [Schizopora paradoxa]